MLIFYVLLLPTMTTNAEEDIPTSTKTTRENLLEDAVIDLLQPQMYEAVQDHYGTTKEIGFMCLKVIDIKKLDHPGSWLFEAKLEGTTYTGPHNPLDIFTVTVRNDYETVGWVMKKYKVKKFEPNKKYEKCREPA